MTDKEMIMGTDMNIDVTNERRNELAVAMNQHIVAKDIAHIDDMRQHETIDRILHLASTRAGLQTLMDLKRGE